MLITQKNQYALRAIYELAKHRGKGLVKISDIAQAQHIPLRFLEVILSQLKRSGLVESKRGYTGGYTLIRSPDEITVREVFGFEGKNTEAIDCLACFSKNKCPFDKRCAFMPMYKQVKDAIVGIYESTTIADLMKNEGYVPDDA